jgi:dolichol-phosphate mannosyltransferase
MEGHDGWVIYYIPAILVGLFPWSIFLPVAAWVAVRNSIMSCPRRPAYLFLVCWAGVWITVFSFAGTKLPSYVLPAYPAIALVCAAFVDDWLAQPECVSKRLMQAAWWTLGLVGGGLVIGLPIAAKSYLPGEEAIAIVGIIPLLGGLACVYLHARRQPQRAMAALTVTAVLLSVSLFGGVALRANRYQNSESLIELARQASADGGVELATYQHAESSVVYYAGERVSRFGEVGDARRFLESNVNAFLITNNEAFDKLSPNLPPGVAVVARQPRFLKGGEVLLLGREVHAAKTGSAQSRWR